MFKSKTLNLVRLSKLRFLEFIFAVSIAFDEISIPVPLEKFNLGKYDLIVSNPPYIPSKDIKNLSKDIINYEPLIAINGGLDGLDLIKKVIYKSNDLLKRNGLLAIEIGCNQYRKALSILIQHGYREIHKEYDNCRNVRCIISTKVGFL